MNTFLVVSDALSEANNGSKEREIETSFGSESCVSTITDENHVTSHRGDSPFTIHTNWDVIACEWYGPKSQLVFTITESNQNGFEILIRSNRKVHVSIISLPILIYDLNFGICFFFSFPTM